MMKKWLLTFIAWVYLPIFAQEDPSNLTESTLSPTILEVQSIDAENSTGFNIQQIWKEKVKEATQGQVIIKLLPTRSVVLHNETLEATELGVLDGYIAPMGFFANRDPAYALLGDMVGAWQSPEEFVTFLSSEVGQKLVAEVHEKDKVVVIGATTPGVETFESVKKSLALMI